MDLDLKDGALINLRLLVSAGRPDLPESYRASLLLDDSRIRGVDYQAIARKKFYRLVVPAGWHQNILDPNLSGDDANRHEALPGFSPGDVADFLHKVGVSR